LIRRLGLAALLFLLSFAARAQLDYAAFGTLDLSYGRFENSGDQPRLPLQQQLAVGELRRRQGKLRVRQRHHRRRQPRDLPPLRGPRLRPQRERPLPLAQQLPLAAAQRLGLLRVGRLQTYLFETSTRFNAFGNSTGFSPSLRQIFLSGNLESIDGDFYWDRPSATRRRASRTASRAA
jgi:hypothetical protein